MSNEMKNGEAVFKFATGERVKIWLPGKRFGMVGTIRRCYRLAKAVMPPPPAENYYSIEFEPGQPDEAFHEDHLELVD